MFATLALTLLLNLRAGFAQTSIVTLPLDTTVDPEWMVVYKVGINGKGPFTCLFDTGANSVILAPDLVSELGLKQGKATSVHGAGADTVRGTNLILKTLELGGFPVPDVPAISVKYPKWLPFRCIVGGAFLAIADIRLDFDRREITMYSVAAFKYTGPGADLPLQFDESNFPSIDATFEGIHGRFLLDTGDSGSISLNAEFVQKHHLLDRYPKQLQSGGATITGTIKATAVRAGVVKIGPYALKGPHADLLSNPRDGHPGFDGTIGIGLLRRFNIVFDGMHGHVFFEPRSNLNDPFVSNRTGMGANPTEDGLFVLTLAPGGPAEEAGVKIGDKIVEIDGTPAGSVDAIRLAKLSQGPVGTELKLVLQRGTEKKAAVLRLRDVL